jgi:hypothetical protein
MKDEIVLKHEFVEFIPEDVRDETIYISMRYATASHKCCCGCGQKVVTPLRPTDWKLIFDGKTISLDPSIGNWSFECRSHYWIRNNRVKWAAQWSQEEVEAGRSNDQFTKKRYFDTANDDSALVAQVTAAPPKNKSSSWQKMKEWWRA